MVLVLVLSAYSAFSNEPSPSCLFMLPQNSNPPPEIVSIVISFVLCLPIPRMVSLRERKLLYPWIPATPAGRLLVAPMRNGGSFCLYILYWYSFIRESTRVVCNNFAPKRPTSSF